MFREYPGAFHICKIIRVMGRGSRKELALYTANITKMMLAIRTVRKKSVDKQSVEKTMSLGNELIEGIAQWF